MYIFIDEIKELMIAGFAYDDGTMMGMSMVTDRYNASFRSWSSLFALVEPYLAPGWVTWESHGKRSIATSFEWRKESNTLLIDVQVCGLSSSLSPSNKPVI